MTETITPPNPATDTLEDVEANAAQERMVADLPKRPDGSVDTDALTPEEAAAYWKNLHDAGARGFHKFKESKDREIADLMTKVNLSPEATPSKTEVVAAAEEADTLQDFESAIPNFELLDPDTQDHLRAIFGAMSAKLEKRLNSDPGVAFARQTFAEQQWERAFEAVAPKFGTDLTSRKADFKAKYYNGGSVPPNIESILAELAKGYLYDVAREHGAQEERDRAGRIDLERGGGPKEPSSTMTVDDWERLRQTNPQAFAARAAEFRQAMNTGQLAE